MSTNFKVCLVLMSLTKHTKCTFFIKIISQVMMMYCKRCTAYSPPQGYQHSKPRRKICLNECFLFLLKPFLPPPFREGKTKPSTMTSRILCASQPAPIQFLYFLKLFFGKRKGREEEDMHAVESREKDGKARWT